MLRLFFCILAFGPRIAMVDTATLNRLSVMGYGSEYANFCIEKRKKFAYVIFLLYLCSLICRNMPVRVEKVNKHIGKQQVLKDISFTLNEGEIVGLLGPNGAGKSTLMKILCGVWEADPEPRTEKQERITVPARIGYLPEQNPLYEDMYIAEYLQFMANISVIGNRLSVIGKDEIEDLIRRVGLTPERNKHIRELSKGYKQRVGLAQALMGQPELLVLDEPTTGLDPNQLTEIRALIRQEASEKRTILLSTHILQEVEALCDRVIIIDHGEIKTDLRMEEIEDLEELFRQKTNN